MLYLVFAVLCSLGVGMIFKWTETRGLDRVALLMVNYIVAVVTAVVLLGWRGAFGAAAFAPSAGLIGFGMGVGLLFVSGYFMLGWATRVAGMGLALSVMRVSVVLPVLASWLVWGKKLSAFQGAGLLLALVAFLLISRRPAPAVVEREPVGRAMLVLTGLFLAGGLVDVGLKAFQEEFSSRASEPLFLLFAFGMALVGTGTVVVGKGLRTGQWPRPQVLGIGAVLGLVNYGSTEFLLRAVGQLSGPFVFPANNVAIVIGGALLGVFVWKESLSRQNWFGIILAALALILLRV